MHRLYLFSTTLLLTAVVFVGCNETPNATTAAPETTNAASIKSDAQTIQFANAKCPIMGGKPKAELTAQYKGKTIGFCCEGCPEKWAAFTEEEKAEKFDKVSHETADSGMNHDGHETHDEHAHGDHS